MAAKRCEMMAIASGLLRQHGYAQPAYTVTGPTDIQASAARARAIVMEMERSLGYEPTDREYEQLGYDIESRIPGTGRLRFGDQCELQFRRTPGACRTTHVGMDLRVHPLIMLGYIYPSVVDWPRWLVNRHATAQAGAACGCLAWRWTQILTPWRGSRARSHCRASARGRGRSVRRRRGAPVTYLLDSSALLAFYFGEPGGERVREILSDDRTVVRLSVLSMAEFWSRLRALGSAESFDEEWYQLSEMMTSIEPISVEVVQRSLELRVAATARLPQMDALIAATAATCGAILVHRDPHFLSIPNHLIQQEPLPEKESNTE
jgi:predicted nucleic acid-binding protein